MEGAGPAGPATGAATGHAPTPAHERRRVPSKPLADGSQLGYIAWVSVESASRMVGHPQARAARRAELQRELGRDYHMASWRCTGPAPVAICTAVLMARLSDGGGWSGAGRAGALGATTPGHGTGRRAHGSKPLVQAAVLLCQGGRLCLPDRKLVQRVARSTPVARKQANIDGHFGGWRRRHPPRGFRGTHRGGAEDEDGIPML